MVQYELTLKSSFDLVLDFIPRAFPRDRVSHVLHLIIATGIVTLFVIVKLN